MIAYYIGLNTGDRHLASTLAFSTLCLARLFHSFNCRGKESILKIGLFTNQYIWYAILTGLALLLAILFITPLSSLFLVSTITLTNLAQIFGLALAPTILIQCYRIIKN
jgi:Ca2+-transporting ATPase